MHMLKGCQDWLAPRAAAWAVRSGEGAMCGWGASSSIGSAASTRDGLLPTRMLNSSRKEAAGSAQQKKAQSNARWCALGLKGCGLRGSVRQRAALSVRQQQRRGPCSALQRQHLGWRRCRSCSGGFQRCQHVHDAVAQLLHLCIRLPCARRMQCYDPTCNSPIGSKKGVAYGSSESCMGVGSHAAAASRE